MFSLRHTDPKLGNSEVNWIYGRVVGLLAVHVMTKNSTLSTAGSAISKSKCIEINWYTKGLGGGGNEISSYIILWGSKLLILYMLSGYHNYYHNNYY
jgi:hypothetical protein